MSETNSSSVLQSISMALQGLGIGLILVVISQLNIKIGGLLFGLSFVPAAALLFWPNRASKTWSIIFVFLIGYAQDVLSFGPPGLWAFSYLAIYLALYEEFKSVSGFGRALSGFLIYVAAIMVPLFFVGRLFLGAWPAWIPLVTDAIISTLAFPLIYWARSIFFAIRTGPAEREVA